MIRTTVFIVAIALMASTSCDAQDSLLIAPIVQEYKQNYNFISMTDTIYTCASEFELPEGFHYPDSSKLSEWSNWISGFPLWHYAKSVGLFRGGKLFPWRAISRVVHLPWRSPHFVNRTIPIRLLGEFYFNRDRSDDFSIMLNNNQQLSYSQFLNNKVAYGAGGKFVLEPKEQESPGIKEFYSYLQFNMRHTTFRSLAENCDSIAADELLPGDMLIAHDETGRKGIAYVVMFMIVDNDGNSLYAVATGGEKACDFYIPHTGSDKSHPWIDADSIAS
ncbi:MAG: DUF4846 domain-containing protein, partial [Candidatus Zixiibacteriota bacterium]